MAETIIIANHDAISYRTISHEIAKSLGENNTVYVLDCGYKGEYHTYPFSLITAIYQALPSHIQYLSEAVKPNRVIFIFDLFKHIRLQQAVQDRKWEYTAVFPIESSPLLPEWVKGAEKLDRRLVISRFGVEVCEGAGLEVEFLPLGLDTEYWSPGDQLAARGECGKFWLAKDATRSSEEPVDIINRITHSKIVLTVADNQERKNLPACFEIVHQLEDTMLVIVAPWKREGWDLHELAKDYNMTERFVWVGGLSKNLLREHYRAADVFLLPSQAEGYGLPLREAAACGLPWVATDCTAISEAPGGIKIPAERLSMFPLGNQKRYWINVEAATEAIREIFKNSQIVGSFEGYPTWGDCARVLVEK